MAILLAALILSAACAPSMPEEVSNAAPQENMENHEEHASGAQAPFTEDSQLQGLLTRFTSQDSQLQVPQGSEPGRNNSTQFAPLKSSTFGGAKTVPAKLPGYVYSPLVSEDEDSGDSEEFLDESAADAAAGSKAGSGVKHGRQPKHPKRKLNARASVG